MSEKYTENPKELSPKELFIEGLKDINNQDLSKTDFLGGFREKLREEDVRVSTPEWIQFLTIIQKRFTGDNLKKLVEKDSLFNTLRIYGSTTLVKDKQYEEDYHRVFDEFFQIDQENQEVDLVLAQEANFIEKSDSEEKPSKPELKSPRESNQQEDDSDDEESKKPEIKDQLGTQEVTDIDPGDSDSEGDESIHGGDKDQHNDILRKQDENKLGGGEGNSDEEGEGEHREASEFAQLKGGGKGNARIVEKAEEVNVVKANIIPAVLVEERKKTAEKVGRGREYEVRPNKAELKKVIRQLRRIISDSSEHATQDVNIPKTVDRFAKKDYRVSYYKEKEKQEDIVLFIDVGGPVDEWSPLVTEMAEEMTKGLSNMEVYLFHNNLYGYAWPPETKNPAESSYAAPDSLESVKKLVKNKKVIIYGDAEMSETEMYDDQWTPSANEKQVENYGMQGVDCLKMIKKRSKSVVWINPIFRREWEDRDDSGTISSIGEEISMHDLSVGGVKDAVKELMRKK